jgi:uncharacterized membrane protein
MDDQESRPLRLNLNLFGDDRPPAVEPLDPDKDTFEAFEERYEREQEIDEGKGAAILAYVPFGCFVALVRYRDNAFAVKHGKQGLVLTFLELLAGLFLIPKLSEYFWVTVVFFCLASLIGGIYHAVQGKEFHIPMIGAWFDKRIET